MKSLFVFELSRFRFMVCVACLFTVAPVAQAAELGHMKADSILFLGNSITVHPAYEGWGSNTDPWGMAATTKSKDYVHVLTSAIDATTGGSLTLASPNPLPTAWVPADGTPSYNGNVLNVADIFERSYSTWDNARVQNQLNGKPDIAVLQFGENMRGGTTEQFKAALETLMDGLKNSSNPHMFVTSFILFDNPEIDAIKQQVCAEDPSHRIFVDINNVGLGSFAHPSDEGMAVIANTLYTAMVAHGAAVPEPSAIAMMIAAGLSFGVLAWRRRRSQGCRF